jgi:hypothetical protein
MAAEENALQFMNETAISNAKTFFSNPTKMNIQYLVHCPAFYKVAEIEFGMAPTSSMDDKTLAVFKWVYVRAFVVLGELSKHGPPGSSVIPEQAIDDWRQVFLCPGCKDTLLI